MLLPAWAGAQAADLLGVTEDLPPYAYREHGRNLGLANEVLNRVAQRSGLKIQRRQQPWALAQATVRSHPNSFLYVTVRAPAREPLYRWVGPVDDCDITLLALQGSGRSFPAQPSDSRPLRIGVVRGSPVPDMLRALGVAERSIYLTPGSETSAKMLYGGHLDMLAGLMLPYAYQAARAGFDPRRLTVLRPLRQGFGCYFAFNPQVSEAVLQRFSQAFEELQRSGELQALRLQYLHAPSSTGKP
ncbi:substrate-binding periplasmic protein [Roseateles sp. BYS180W]|uniref:Substrate-binding periplasmic protein n=1 Tax=Roseateles rivi TaxID=3299028 RepID=A0ABW7FTK1_9BURK